MKKLYDAFFTLGAACQASCILRDLGLRDKAYPFDWVYNKEYNDNTILNRVDIIEKLIDYPDLTIFLGKKNDLKYVKSISQLNDLSNLHHSYYNKNNGIVFSHDFVLSKQISHVEVLDQAYDSVYYKYRKRCNRLVELLCNSNKKVLAVWVGRPIDNLIRNEAILQAYTKLEMTSNAKVDLLVLQHVDDQIGYSLSRPKSGLVICTANYSRYSVYDASEIDRIKTAAVFGYAISYLQKN